MISAAAPWVPQVLGTAVVLSLCALLLGVVGSRLTIPTGVRVLAWVSFGSHFVAGAVLLLVLGLRSSDAYGYHVLATSVADYIGGGTASSPSLIDGKDGWIWLLGAAYLVVTPAPLAGVAMNSFFLATALLLSYRLALDITGSNRAARAGAWLFLLVPGHVVWGSIPLREASVALLCSVIAYYGYRTLLSSRPQEWFLTLLAVAGLAAVRGSMAVLIGASIAVVHLLRTLAPGVPAGRRVLALGAVLILTVVSLQSLEGIGRETTTERIKVIRSAQSSEADTGFDTGVAGTDAGPLWFGVAGMPRVVLGPFPWELGSVVSLLPSIIYWWAIVILVCRGLRRRPVKKTTLLLLVLPTIAVLLALAVYSGNYGTMIRLRDQVLPFLIPLAAVGWFSASADKRLGRPRRWAAD